MAFRGGKNKYGAKKAEVDGIKFDSKKEAGRYMELLMLQHAKQITGLELQPKYPLMVGHDRPVKSRTARYPKGRTVSYFADFLYYNEKGALVVEDVKGMDTDVSRIKRACVEAYYRIEIILI